MAHEELGFERQAQNLVVRSIQGMCVATGEVASSGAVIRHEQRVADEGGVCNGSPMTYVIQAGVMAKGVYRPNFYVPNGNALAVSKQMIKMPTIASEIALQIEKRAEDRLHRGGMLSNA